MLLDTSGLPVHSNAREVSNMLVGTGQLIKERSLAAVLITCERKRENLSFRKRLLSCLLVVLTTLTKTRVMLVVGVIMMMFYPSPLSYFFDLYLLCIMFSERKLITMNAELDRIAHRSVLNESHLHTGDNSHVQKVLPQRTLSSYRRNYAGRTDRQISKCHLNSLDMGRLWAVPNSLFKLRLSGVLPQLCYFFYHSS